MSRKTNKAAMTVATSPDSDKQPETMEGTVNLLKALTAQFAKFHMETNLSKALLENSKLFHSHLSYRFKRT
jgi:hypothetical protein